MVQTTTSLIFPKGRKDALLGPNGSAQTSGWNPDRNRLSQKSALSDHRGNVTPSKSWSTRNNVWDPAAAPPADSVTVEPTLVQQLFKCARIAQIRLSHLGLLTHAGAQVADGGLTHQTIHRQDQIQ